jgi:hypothetical protein
VSLTFKEARWARATSSSSSLGSMLTSAGELSATGMVLLAVNQMLPTARQEGRPWGWSRERSGRGPGSRTSTTTGRESVRATSLFRIRRVIWTDHDERRVTRGAAEVDETTLSEEDDVTTRGKGETVNLGLDVDDLGGGLLDPSDVDLDVKVTDAVVTFSAPRVLMKMLPTRGRPTCKRWRPRA